MNSAPFPLPPGPSGLRQGRKRDLLRRKTYFQDYSPIYWGLLVYLNLFQQSHGASHWGKAHEQKAMLDCRIAVSASPANLFWCTPRKTHVWKA